jgi:ABC-type polysaccharide/polyol phosphate transport system ATPase subunit
VFAVRVEGVEKEFARGGRRFTLFGMIRSLAADSLGNAARRPALSAIDFEVQRGEMLGVIGANGAGKTTLLKTVAGIYAPTRGTVRSRGDLALLAGLGAGMVDELTVADNIHLYGAICRVRRAVIKERFDEILEWAELEGFVDAELRTLSTGMRTRLAFAITTHMESDTVLMDEAFSAGDKSFQGKCNRFFEHAKQAERTYIIATHKLDFVRQFCDRALWIDKGRQIAFGPSGPVLDAYVDAATKSERGSRG